MSSSGSGAAQHQVIDITVVEPKVCECCGRLFMRQARSLAIYCASCEGKFGLQEDDEVDNTKKPVVGTATPARTRICKAAGCEATLVYNNKSGFCQRHAPRRVHSKANGRGPALDAVSKENGHGVGERLNMILAGIPPEDKMRMIQDWLRGKN